MSQFVCNLYVISRKDKKRERKISLVSLNTVCRVQKGTFGVE